MALKVKAKEKLLKFSKQRCDAGLLGCCWPGHQGMGH